MSGALIQQPISLDSGKRFVLKVQPAKAGTGLGRSKGTVVAPPLWSLVEGINTLWEYNTSDLELIFNLVEEAVYSSNRSSAPVADRNEAAMAVLEEMAAAHGIGLPNLSNISYGGSHDDNPSPQGNFASAANKPGLAAAPTGSYAAMEKPMFSSEPSGFSGQYAAQTAPQAAAPAVAEPPSQTTGTMQMSGTLSELAVCDLFQSIGVGKMTGRLDLSSGLESIEIYFEEGSPRRASFRSDAMSGENRDITGEEVLLEAMTWKTGFFQFNAAIKSAERSPMRRLDLLLLEGATLRDYADALENAGLTADSMPVRTAKLSEAEFEKALTEGIPVNIEKQKAVYIAFDGKTVLSDVVRQTGLPKSAWLPLIFNLHNCGLVGMNVKAQNQPVQTEAPQSPMMKESIQEAFHELLRPDTMLMSYPLFMHFLEVEFQRALRLRLPFSLIIVGVHKEGAGIKEQLSSEDLKLVAERMRQYLEPYDHLGHYQTLDLGILLPHRPSALARDYIKKIIEDINRELAQGGNGVRFVWSVGIGCVPEDGIKLSGMVSKTELERNSPQPDRR